MAKWTLPVKCWLFFTGNFAIVQVFTVVHSFYYSWHADSPFAVHGFYQ